MKFHYQATGTDIIPNKNLWIQFPLLVKVKKVKALDMENCLSTVCCRRDVCAHLVPASVSFEKKSEVDKAIRKHYSRLLRTFKSGLLST